MKAIDEIWAIIPTRGGSKGLPEKNIIPIAGKPLLDYMVTEALRACFKTHYIFI
jgi:CMP-N-acetylneuraminic acid synthetase